MASFGVIVSSLALFIILSGFSGLRTFSYSLLDVSDPDINITSTKGKSFILDKNIKQHIEDKSSILGYSKVIEERVFLEYADKNEIAYIKGVDDNYTTITKIDSAIYIGDWLDKNYRNTAIIGRATALKLSLGVNSYGKPLTIMVPKPGKGFINPTNAFYKMEVQILGIYSGTEEFESKYVFVTLNQAKNLLKFKDNQVSALELKIKDTDNTDAVAEKLQNLLGSAYTVKTKEQLNEVFYKVINTENFVSYLIFTLIIIIALFNVIGAIIMMIIDKKQNLKILYSLGLTIEEIKKIFRYQGFLLTCFGMLVGLLLGIILVLLQDSYGLFMITQSLAYPVELQLYNVFIVIFTITVLGFFAAKIASSRINKKFIEK